TPLRVTPAEPATAGAVMPLGTASARWLPATPQPAPPLAGTAHPVGPPPPALPAAVPPLPVAPATVVSVALPVVPPVPASWPKPADTFVGLLGVTLGTSQTTRSSTRKPINRGEYRRATFAM